VGGCVGSCCREMACCCCSILWTPIKWILGLVIGITVIALLIYVLVRPQLSNTTTAYFEDTMRNMVNNAVARVTGSGGSGGGGAGLCTYAAARTSVWQWPPPLSGALSWGATTYALNCSLPALPGTQLVLAVVDDASGQVTTTALARGIDVPCGDVCGWLVPGTHALYVLLVNNSGGGGGRIDATTSLAEAPLRC